MDSGSMELGSGASPLPASRGRGRKHAALGSAAVVIYDEDCRLCRAARRWIERRARPGMLEFLGCRSPERELRFPSIDTDYCLQALQLVLPDGHVLSGDRALPEILERLRGWRLLARLLRFGPAQALGPVLYGWIARHRLRLSCPDRCSGRAPDRRA